MKLILKKNRIIISALAIMIAIAGYLNLTKDTIPDEGEKIANEMQDSLGYDVFTYDSLDGYEFSDISDEDLLAYDAVENNNTENETVADNLEQDEIPVVQAGSEQSVIDEGKASDDQSMVADSGDEEEDSTATGEAVLASVSLNNAYFSTAKLTREQTRARNKEMLMGIVADASVSQEQKQAAIDSIVLMADIAEMENASELLLEAKGFEDVVVSIVDNTVDVVVNSASVTVQQVTQIEDIIMRKTGMDAECIVVSAVVCEE